MKFQTALLVFVCLFLVIAAFLGLTHSNNNNNKFLHQEAPIIESKVKDAIQILWSLNSYEILQQKDELYSDDGGSPIFLKRTVIARNEQGNFLLGIFYSNDQPYLLKAIDEIRARRALFLYPNDYQKAFGERPEKSQIFALKKHSEQA